MVLGDVYYAANAPAFPCCAAGFYAVCNPPTLTINGSTILDHKCEHGEWRCAICNSAGFVCPRECTVVESLNLAAGYWRGNAVVEQTGAQVEAVTHECWNAGACRGGAVALPQVWPLANATADAARANEYCATGYMGPYCAVCDIAAGYAPQAGASYTCQQCTTANKAAAYTGIGVVVLVVGVTAVYLLPFWDINEQPGALAVWGSKRSVLTCCSSCHVRFNGNYLRIPIIVIQLVAGFLEVTGLQLAPTFENFIHKLAILPNLSFAWGCVYNATFYEKLLAMTLGPLVAVALLGCSWLWAVAREHRLRRVAGADAARAARLKALRKHWTAFLALTFLVYGTVSSIIFQTFACDYVQELDTYYLRADYSIQCYSNSEYWRYFAYAMTMFVVYPLGVPALYALLLCFKRRQHQARQGAVATAPSVVAALSQGDSVHGDMRVRMHYPAPPRCDPNPTRRVLTKQVGATAGGGRGLQQVSQWADDSTLHCAPLGSASADQPKLLGAAAAELANEGHQQGLEPHWDLVHASSFLWAQYKPKAEWWEMVECARRVVLTGVLVFILPGSAGQAAVSVLFAFLLTLIFMAVRPHREHAMQRQYLLGAVIVYFASMNALLIKSQVSGAQSQLVVGIVMILISSALIVAAVAQTLYGVADLVRGSERQPSPLGLSNFTAGQLRPQSA
eukprot:TRINITY_DN8588_c0_g2_i1.p1 TRINITY_DN8588_c0_g2~~TRINITY_DN8588_c0_g2_i1.p1  ORF type:complete len:745 (-),score=149.91 TRINITY_DN8588_c0_g2_i1:53-2086(-)